MAPNFSKYARNSASVTEGASPPTKTFLACSDFPLAELGLTADATAETFLLLPLSLSCSALSIDWSFPVPHCCSDEGSVSLGAFSEELLSATDEVLLLPFITPDEDEELDTAGVEVDTDDSSKAGLFFPLFDEIVDGFAVEVTDGSRTCPVELAAC